MAPSATGAPGTPGTTTPHSFKPMKARNKPMPTVKLRRSESGMALTIQLRTLRTVRMVNRTPAMKMAPKAVCQGKPNPLTTV